MKTKQDVYQRIRSHLLTQGRRSEFNGRCMYRNPDGLQCAIGCLISEEYYSEGLEQQTIFSRHVAEAVKKSNPELEMSWDVVNLLKALQEVHDFENAEKWKDLPETVEEFTKMRGL